MAYVSVTIRKCLQMRTRIMAEFQLLGFYICVVGSLFYLINTICLYVELEGKNHLEDSSLYGMVMLNWILKK